MEYFHFVASSSPIDLAGTLNLEVQELVHRYGNQQQAKLDIREDSFDRMIHCCWAFEDKRSPCVRFDTDLGVKTFGNEHKAYNLLYQAQFEQLIYDTMDSLIPDWGENCG